MARIVYVDDQPVLLQGMKTYLQEAGHEVWATDSGAEALGRIQAGEADLLVQDVLRPVLDGRQLLRALWSDPKWTDFPVIIVSGVATAAGLPVRGVSAEDHSPCVDMWLKKPWLPSQLILAVTTTLAARDARRTRQT